MTIGASNATLESREPKLTREGYSSMAKVISRLSRGNPLEFVNALRRTALKVCYERSIPIPSIGAGVESGEARDTIGPDGIQTQAWWLK